MIDPDVDDGMLDDEPDVPDVPPPNDDEEDD